MVLQGTTVIKIAFIKLKVIILIVLNQYTKARMYLIVSVGRARFSAQSYYSAAAGQAGRSGKSKLFELLILKKKKKKKSILPIIKKKTHIKLYRHSSSNFKHADLLGMRVQTVPTQFQGQSCSSNGLLAPLRDYLPPLAERMLLLG